MKKFNKNLTIKSFTGINYKSFPTNIFTSNTSQNFQYSKIDSSKDMPKNYEEINDYSFLNIITEEITNLEFVTDSAHLQEVLTNSLVDNTSNTLNKNFSDKDFNKLVKNLNNSDYKALLHNVNYVSYVEIIDSTNDNTYCLQLQDDGLYKVGDNNLDNLLTYLIESNTYKN